MNSKLTDKERDVAQVECRYGTMFTFERDLIIGQSLRQYGEWAQAEIDFLKELLDPGAVVVDAGAFIGTHTLAFARFVGKAGKVLAFEPQRAFFELLQRNVEENALSNVQLFNVALSEARGAISACGVGAAENNNFGAMRLTVMNAEGDERDNCIEARTLDEYDLERCDVIKMDVEGMEARILEGGKQTIQRLRPVVYAECNALADGWPVAEFALKGGYQVLLHNAKSYNHSNFRGCSDNLFGGAREAALVLVPSEKLADLNLKCATDDFLVPIDTLDDLALGLLKKPQYKQEVLGKTKVGGVLGTAFWANEPEVQAFQRHVQELGEAVVQSSEQLAEREAEQARLSMQLAEREAEQARLSMQLAERESEIVRLESVVVQRDRQVVEILSSTSWRISSPVRWFGRLARAAARKNRRLRAEIGTEKLSTAIPQHLMFSIDHLRIRGARIYGWGWAFDKKQRVSSVSLIARTKNKTEIPIRCTYGIRRADVAMAHGDYPVAEHSGFVISGWIPKEPLDKLFVEVGFPESFSERIPLGTPFNYVRRQREEQIGEARRLVAEAVRYIMRRDIAGLKRKVKAKAAAITKKRQTPRINGAGLITRLRRNASQTSLIIDHNLGGGANFYRTNLISEKRQANESVILIYYDLPTLEYYVQISDRGDNQTFRFDSFGSILDVAREIPLRSVFVNNLVSVDEPLAIVEMLPLIREINGASLTVAIHDFFPICPSWTLLDREGHFCGVPDLKQCHQCLPKHQGHFSLLVQDRDIDEWREAWQRCLEAADTILCFSESSAQLVRRAYPQLDTAKFEVKPHTVEYLPSKQPNVNLSAPLNIGVVGEITEHKGASIIRQMSELIAGRKLPIKVTVIGTISEPLPNVVDITGPYRREELGDLIETKGVNVCFVPSIWPETFSYTTEEIIKLNVPVAVFDLGAPADRVRTYLHGLVIPELTAASALECIREFHAVLRNTKKTIEVEKDSTRIPGARRINL